MDHKQIIKDQKFVLRRYPKAKLERREETQELTVMVGDWDLLGEFYMTPNDEQSAWEMARVAARTKQNFDRTHPMRDTKGDKAGRIYARLTREQKENGTYNW